MVFILLKYATPEAKNLLKFKEIWLYLEFLKRLVVQEQHFCHIADMPLIWNNLLISLMNRCSISQVRPSLAKPGWQHSRPPCPFGYSGVTKLPCPFESVMCHPTASSSVTLLLLPQTFPASGFFPMMGFSSCDQNYWTLISFNIQYIKLKDSFPILTTFTV